MEPEQPKVDVIRAYRARKLRRWVGMILLLAAIVLQLAQPGIPAVSEALAQWIFGGMLVAFLALSLLDWKCPACGRSLGRAPLPQAVPHLRRNPGALSWLFARHDAIPTRDLLP